MTPDAIEAIDRATSTLSVIETATNQNISEEPRYLTAKLLKYLLSTLPSTKPHDLLIQELKELKSEFDEKFTPEKFKRNFKTHANIEFGLLLRKLLYVIRRHMYCMELFPNHAKSENAKSILMQGLQNYVAPILCAKSLGQPMFIKGFCQSPPTHWLPKKIENSILADEAYYYIKFAFVCSGKKDPNSKNKIYAEAKRNEISKGKLQEKESDRPNIIDFYAYLVAVCRITKKKEERSSSPETSIAQFLADEYFVKNLEEIITFSHCDTLMILQDFLWTHYNIKPGAILKNLIDQIIEHELQTINSAINKLSESKIAKKNPNTEIKNNFDNLLIELDHNKYDQVAIVNILLEAQGNKLYNGYYDLTETIQNGIQFIMQFWFYYRIEPDIHSKLIKIYKKLPITNPIHERLGNFLLNLIQQETSKTNESESLLSALLVVESQTLRFNPGITPYLRQLPETCSFRKKLCENRNHNLHTLFTGRYSEHTVMVDSSCMTQALLNKLKKASFWQRLNQPKLRDVIKQIEDLQPNDPSFITTLLKSLNTLTQNSRFSSVSQQFNRNCYALVLQNLIETKQYETCTDKTLCSILENLPCDLPNIEVIIDQLWKKRNSLDAYKKYQLLISILKQTEISTKYHQDIDTLYNKVIKHCTYVINNPDVKKQLMKLYTNYHDNLNLPTKKTSLMRRLKKAFNILVQQNHHEPDPPEKLRDPQLAQLLKKERDKEVNSLKALTLDEKKATLYTRLKRELTQFLSIQQYIHEMEEHRAKHYSPDRAVIIDNDSDRTLKNDETETFYPHRAWIELLEIYPYPQTSTLPSQPYAKAAKIADQLASATTQVLTNCMASLTDDDLTPQRLASIARFCYYAYSYIEFKPSLLISSNFEQQISRALTKILITHKDEIIEQYSSDGKDIFIGFEKMLSLILVNLPSSPTITRTESTAQFANFRTPATTQSDRRHSVLHKSLRTNSQDGFGKNHDAGVHENMSQSAHS